MRIFQLFLALVLSFAAGSTGTVMALLATGPDGRFDSQAWVAFSVTFALLGLAAGMAWLSFAPPAAGNRGRRRESRPQARTYLLRRKDSEALIKDRWWEDYT